MTKTELNNKMNEAVKLINEIAAELNNQHNISDSCPAGTTLVMSYDLDYIDNAEFCSCIESIKNAAIHPVLISLEDACYYDSKYDKLSVLETATELANQLYVKPKFFVENSKIVEK